MKIEKKDNLFVDIKQLIEQSKWHIGQRINEDVLKNNRAEYGKQIVVSLARQLQINYGEGWSEKQLRQCMQFATAFPEKEIVYTLCIQLSWSHIRLIMFMEDPLNRVFRERIQSMLYERTAISKKPDETIKQELELELGIRN